MVKREAVVKNGAGIHVRPSGEIFKKIENFDGNILLKAKGMELPLDGIMNLIVLGLQQGDSLEIFVDGDQEEEYADRLKAAFEKVYDFPR